jgi:uncharacterized protein (TIGR00255 family)
MKPLTSMTGFASASGAAEGLGWTWELRSVNGRGLDLRFRLPPGLDQLESELRHSVAGRLTRGTVTANLRLQASEAAGVVVDRALLLRLAEEADWLAAQRPGAPAARLEVLMTLPGVVRRESGDGVAVLADSKLADMKAGFAVALDELVAGRQAEGGRLQAVLGAALDRLAALHASAGPAAAAQVTLQQARLGETVGKLLAEWPAAAPAERLAQELAVLASRSDVTEEVDRLASHLDAARALLAAGGPAGRQLDFLVQEFMREANTLCSKSASVELTGIGLQMKGVIEQIREQVQNIE